MPTSNNNVSPLWKKRVRKSSVGNWECTEYFALFSVVFELVSPESWVVSSAVTLGSYILTLYSGDLSFPFPSLLPCFPLALKSKIPSRPTQSLNPRQKAKKNKKKIEKINKSFAYS